ncbi:TonB-dependent siderophore receptor [Pseudomonas benzenivorans]|uniref:TonB-dependent siderophore receptor n=1 Tax=Pseudomonas benzenivorans TaxID=556533 RepID=UPI0035127EDB
MLDESGRRVAMPWTCKTALCLGILAANGTVFAAEKAAVLPSMSISGASAGETYYESKAGAATRTDTPLRELPQSVRVLPRQVLDDIGAMSLNDSLDYVSGVSRQNNFGGTWDNIAIRGFAGHENSGMSLLRNGFSSNRGFNAPRDLANVESIEFLKGPSAALYGNSEPGGTVNVVTKKPQFQSAHHIETSAGSHDFYRLAADTTGPIGQNLAYRLNVATEDKNSFRDHIDSQRQLIAPALTWILSERTVLSYDGEYLRQDAPLDRGIVAVNGKVTAVPRENFLGDPNDGDVTLENTTHQFTLEHELTDRWLGRLGLAYKTGTLDGTSSEVKSFVDVTGDSVTLRRRHRDYETDDLTVQAELLGHLELAGMQHTVLVGSEAYQYSLDSRMRQLNNSMRIDNILGKPVYTTLREGLGNLIVNREEEQSSTALFVQDEVALSDRWKLLAGLRYERYEQSLDNRLNDSSTDQDDAAVSPRLGVTFLIDPNWSWYATTGKSFRPNGGTDANGKAFEAEQGRALETGVKFESLDRRIGATLALFQIDKENVLTGSDPNGVFSVAAGEARSRGLEVDLSGRLTERLRASMSYAYLDTEVTKDQGGAVDWLTGEVVNLEGKPLANIPKHSASLFLMWEDALQSGGSWGLGGGVSYVGERSGNYLDSFTLPSYTTVKLSSHWQVDQHLRLSLNIDNLFDRNYIASSYDRSWLTPGEPRNLTLKMTVSL